ncbi:N-acetylglucosaminidase [Pseudozyma hubeiensis SY62]|uniref:beta-N-acetylhexosaminidase n=1 Tax=Pseudozyma hubeiensis (strain SY62) TaxID=1305764 RepID=R9NYC1_PSEHS|nr:N-acetylglucosaminidase [Pseudozyma hubeiensis SY62]GAC93656.1 N-acetylglucosaminidase [Pseudozyma hubeiensis SY62]
MGPDLDPGSVQAETIPLSHLPRIRICISKQSLAQAIVRGVEQLVRHHIRPDVLHLHQSTQPIAASGVPPTATSSSNSASLGPVWNWNLEFVEVTSDVGDELYPDSSRFTWVCSTSSDTFAPFSSNESTCSQQVETPFVITAKYPSRSPHLAFRALGHVLAVAKDCLSLSDNLDPTLTLHPHLFVGPSSSQSPHGYYLSPAAANDKLNITQTADYETIGTMIDCSRNGVLNVRSTKYLIRTLALLGYNMLQLYTEDTYEVDGEPFFGYMRGGYSHSELRHIDDYAIQFGIEVIPCIQTLGHLGQMLQWPRYLGLRDTAEVLLPEWPETYVMLEKMIRAATAPFRSKRIHLGMDETHGLGHGRYFSIYGHQNNKPGSQIFVEHLAKVNRICQSLQLEPMIWSDMLFCLSARNNSLVGYYDSDQPLAVKQQGIPSNCSLVYWDYYHTSAASYRKRIKNHEDLRGASPWLAAGSWTWSRFWTALPFTFQTISANLKAAKNSPGVKHVFLTIWGDEGNEVDLWSSLPAWCYYADHAYSTQASLDETVEPGNEAVDVRLLKSKFDAIVGGDWDDFVHASAIDHTTKDGLDVAEDDKIHFAPNTSKWMLWSDPMHSFAEPTLVASGFDAEEHYRNVASMLSERLEGVTLQDPLQNRDQLVVKFSQTQSSGKASGGLFGAAASLLSEMTGRSGAAAVGGPKTVRILSDHPFNARLELARLVAQTLSLKANLRQRLHQAYVSRNWPQLQQLNRRTARCLDAATKTWRYHREMWMSMYKPHGWETLELRYGGLVSRLDTLYRRVGAFLQHVLSSPDDEADELDAVQRSSQRADVFLPRPTNLDGRASGDSSKRSSLDKNGSDEENDNDDNSDGDDESMRSRSTPRSTKWGWQEKVTSLPELEKPLHLVYGSAEQLLDYHRVSRPTYC